MCVILSTWAASLFIVITLPSNGLREIVGAVAGKEAFCWSIV